MPITVSRDTGQAIRKARIKVSMSQEELSNRIEKELGKPVSPTLISKWETGRLTPRPDMIKALNKVLGLFEDNAETASPKAYIIKRNPGSKPVAQLVTENQPEQKARLSARETLLKFADEFEKHEDAAINAINGIKNDFGSVIFHFNEIRKLNIIHTLGYKNILDYVEHEFGIDSRTYSALAQFQQRYGEKNEKGDYTGALSPESNGGNIINLLMEIAKDNAYAQQGKLQKEEPVKKQEPADKTKPTTVREIRVTAGSTMDKIIHILEDTDEKTRLDILAILKP